ncbi:MAG: sensor histidine kinase [Saprospiraceae bacterium]
MRISIVIFLTIVFSASSIIFEQIHSNSIGLRHYAGIIEKELLQRKVQTKSLLDEMKKSGAEINPIQLSKLLREKKCDPDKIQIFLYEEDSLVFWNNSKIVCAKDSSEGVHHLYNGYYDILKKQIAPELTVLALLPIKYDYPLDFRFNRDNKYLQNSFVARDDIHGELSLTATDINAIPILNTDNSAACYLISGNNNLMSQNDQYQLLLLYLITFFFLALLINSLTIKFMKNKYPKTGMVFLSIAVLGMKLLSSSFDLSYKFDSIPLFMESLGSEKLTGNSPGTMFVNIILLLWIIVFYYKNIKPIESSNLSKGLKISVMALLYIALITGILMTFELHQEIISSPNLVFDFDNFYYIDISSALTILCLLLVWFALFLFNFKVISNIQSLGFSRQFRTTTTIIIGIATYGVLAYNNNFDLRAEGIVLFIFMYILLLDIFCDNRESFHLSWFLLWLTVFAGATTTLLYHYKRNADLKVLAEAGNRLAADVDTIAEKELEELCQEIEAEKYKIHNKEDLLEFIGQSSPKKGYLLDHYTLQLSEKAIFTEKSTLSSLLNKDSIYVYSVTLPVMSDSSQTEYFRLEATPKSGINTNGYEEKFFETPFLSINDSPHINYSIFQNGRLIKWNDSAYPSFPEANNLPAKGNSILIKNMEYSRYILRTDDEKIVVADIEYGGAYKILFLFTYILVYLFGISCFIITLNTFTNILDAFFVFPQNSSLESKVEIGVICLVTFACIFIGAATILHAKNAFEKNYATRLAQKMESVQKNIENDLPKSPDSVSFNTLLSPISETHQVDIIAYDLNGKMIDPLGKSIVRKGIVSPLLNPEAYETLSKGKSCFLNEKIGGFEYKTAYGEIRKNETPFAYFAIPYYRREWERNEAVSEFTGALLAVYVFLLIPMVIFTYMVGEKLLKPIKTIGEKLKLVKLGQTHLDIEWKGKDALGDLIREFDHMLSNLGKEAKAEQQTARDEAWRSMARQIAHDIRNPLTPMKLSIQYLEYFTLSTDIDPEIKQRVTRISGTLVEQINNLNQIATNFADFSKTQTENSTIEKIQLNEFVALNCELFINSLESQLEVNLHLPDEKYLVNIDKTQMSRVITNLITNARQSIPDNVEGKIDIDLYRENMSAIIRIRDNGSGIAAEQIEQIFQPNFTTRSSGTGLGLAICRRLVEDIHGKIYCSSILNEGSDFFVEIPIAEIQNDSPAEKSV